MTLDPPPNRTVSDYRMSDTYLECCTCGVVILRDSTREDVLTMFRLHELANHAPKRNPA